jgi:hypothetical protein
MTKYSILPDIATNLKYQTNKYKFDLIGQPNPHLITFRLRGLEYIEMAYVFAMSIPHFHLETDTTFYPLTSCLMLHGSGGSGSLSDSTGFNEDEIRYETNLSITNSYQFHHAVKGDIHSFGPIRFGEVATLLICSSGYRERTEEYPDDTIFCKKLNVNYGKLAMPDDLTHHYGKNILPVADWFYQQANEWKDIHINHIGYSSR